MADKLHGVESSAISILKRAVELDTSKRYDEAVTCYQEGLQLMLEVIKGTCTAPCSIRNNCSETNI